MSSRGEGGYTLLELLVVLAVMGLVLAAIPEVAMPVIDGMRLSARVAEVTYRLQQARERAIETGKAVVVTDKDFVDMGGGIVPPSDGSTEITIFPDGSVRGDAPFVEYRNFRKVLEINQITGRINAL